MGNLLLLGLCFALGAAARRTKLLPTSTPQVLNAWVLYVSLPALVLRVIHRVTLQGELALAAASMWLLAALTAVAALVAVKRGWASAGVAGAVALCCGLSNTSFVGLPLVEVVAGQEALGPATVVDQAGSFLALSFIGVPLAVTLGGGRPSAGALLLRVVKFPPFLALGAALALRPLAFPAPLEELLERLAAMLSPLALASVGWQLDLSTLKGQGRPLALGLAHKLVLSPALVFAAFALASGPLGLVEKVAVLQAGMAPMVTGGVVASEQKLSPALCSSLVALGVPLSFVTVPLWWQALSWWSP